MLDGEMITQMGFFITDLHRHIEQLYKAQYANYLCEAKFIVYRGQGLSEADFNELMKTKDGLLSFNSFLSTSKDRDVALAFAESNSIDHNMIGVLFVIEIDVTQATTPFACLRGISYFPDEDELLFSMHSVFQINDIQRLNKNERLYEVNLTLTGDDNAEFRTLTNSIRKESSPTSSGWHRLVFMLIALHQTDVAEAINKELLEEKPNESGHISIYHSMAIIKYKQGEYQEAVRFHEKAISIEQRLLPSTHAAFAESYNSIGTVYHSMGDYSKALSAYEKSLGIQQQSLLANYPDLGQSYNNIGAVYNHTGGYPNALPITKKLAVFGNNHFTPIVLI
ncbi:unnamed protein product [Adineta ricciae]|uniref:ADP ribosyltransferase domain-containing protein n=1 Tax=Adineta ricciae TaxID=249248 RepID=A0A813XG79_ADIRI|nr:unnamed protein product [Adineta ricciae]CAF1048112.1 unnamed protein product [Adineta ricciae]